MLSTWLGLSSPLVCFVFHFLIYRLFPPAHRMQKQKLTVLVILLSVASLTLLQIHSAADAFHTAVLSLLFGYTYFHWFNMSETARRISILVRIVDSGELKSAPDYSVSNIFSQRIQRLREVGTLYQQGDKLFVKKGPLLLATRLILFWRSLFYPK